jgi:GTP-sensing pleiotropic transcriptional regulator CodY
MKDMHKKISYQKVYNIMYKICFNCVQVIKYKKKNIGYTYKESL